MKAKKKRNKEANGNLLNGQLYQEWPKALKQINSSSKQS